MIDLAGLPTPADAPPAGACVRIERPEPGLARIHLDPPHRKIALFDVPLLADLDRALEEIARDPKVKALVIAGKDPLTFAAGADVETILGIQDPVTAKKFAREGQKLYQRLFKMGRRGGGRIATVAAVGGPVPGGACELALACDRIVLANHDRSRIGLPEVKLGILPAWGGTQRMPRRIGVPAALEAILSGRLFAPRQAYKLGIVDRLTAPEYLWSIAGDVALGRVSCPYRGRAGVRKVLVDRNPLAGAVIQGQARKRVLAETRGHYPAALAAIPLVVRAPRVGIENGLASEAEAVLPLSTSPVARRLIGIFLASEDAKKLASGANGARVKGFERAAVIGAGVMGAGIASLMAERGIHVRLRDLDRSQLDSAQVAHRAEIEKKQKRKQLLPHQADAAVDRLVTTTVEQGFARCEFALEAVAEKLEVKRAVLGALAAQMAPDAILATNTSSLSVGEIAAMLPNPERVVGMHFFNPPRKMPLVEIVRAEKTSDEVVQRTARLALDLGKTPVVVADVAGFLVNRVLGPYLDEAVRLVESGVDPFAIDEALLDFGMPMGPCELLDEVGLDIAQHAAASLEKAYGERAVASKFLVPLVEAKELGKKTGRGIYVWKKKERGKLEKDRRNPRAATAKGELKLPDAKIVDRCVLALLNESARALEEKVVSDAGVLDLAVVFGTGFAPFRGGVLAYADARGLPEIVERLTQLREELASEGQRLARFEPAPLLVELAKKGGRFHA